jgi:hypothetical protein
VMRPKISGESSVDGLIKAQTSGQSRLYGSVEHKNVTKQTGHEGQCSTDRHQYCDGTNKGASRVLGHCSGPGNDGQGHAEKGTDPPSGGHSPSEGDHRRFSRVHKRRVEDCEVLEAYTGRDLVVKHAEQRAGAHAQEDDSDGLHFAQSYFWRLTISLIQIGAKGEVQPFETG